MYNSNFSFKKKKKKKKKKTIIISKVINWGEGDQKFITCTAMSSFFATALIHMYKWQYKWMSTDKIYWNSYKEFKKKKKEKNHFHTSIIINIYCSTVDYENYHTLF